MRASATRKVMTLNPVVAKTQSKRLNARTGIRSTY
jgi:hypothetical protein